MAECNDGVVLFVMIFAVVWLLSVLPQAFLDRSGQMKVYDAMTRRVSFAPPAITFSIVWSILNVLVSVALYLVLDTNERCIDSSNAALVTLFFMLQLLQTFYTPVFFGLRWGIVGVLIVGVCFSLAIATTVFFWMRSTAAGLLMMPLGLWLSFALALSVVIEVVAMRVAAQRRMLTAKQRAAARRAADPFATRRSPAMQN